MIKKQMLALVVLAASATLVHAADEGKKDPKTGKSCVTYVSSEPVDSGLLRMNYRNTCDSPFEIRISAGQNTRKKSIEAGSADKPARAYVTCKSSDGCETAKWLYE